MACICGANIETDHLALVAGGRDEHPYTGSPRRYGTQVEALESAAELLDLDVYPDDMGTATLQDATGGRSIMLSFAENGKVACATYRDRTTGDQPRLVGGSLAEIIAVLGEIARG